MTARGLRRDPVSLLLSRQLWAGAWYLLAYLVVGWGLFAVALTVAIGGGVLSVTVAGLPALIAAAVVIRWCADAERARLGVLTGEEPSGGYREFTGSGLLARLRHMWSDRQLWRDIAYLFGLLAPLLVLDLTVLVVWLVLLAGITTPIWYWAPWQTVHGVRYHGYQLGYFPNGPHGPGGWGLYVDTLPKALLAAAACLILFLLFSYVVAATAGFHARVARSLLAAREDPLREAKEVLRQPGPLSSHNPNRLV